MYATIFCKDIAIVSLLISKAIFVFITFLQ